MLIRNVKSPISFAFTLVALTLFCGPLFAQDIPNNSVNSVFETNSLPASGEIALSGTVTSFDGTTNILTVETGAFTIPNGQTATLKTKKSKSFALLPNSTLVSDFGQSLEFGQILIGALVMGIGPDDGTGSVLQVRWLRVENSTLSEAPTAQAPLISPAITPEIVAPLTASPTLAVHGATPTPKPVTPAKPTPKLVPKPTPRPSPAPIPLPVAGLPKPPVNALMTFADLSPWLQKAEQIYPDLIRRRALAVTAQGRPIVAFEICPENADVWRMRRLAVVCRQHGDEPETSAAGAEFIYQLLTSQNPRAQRLRQTVAVLIVPVANPDGAVRKNRYNGVGQDLNRDWGRSHSREVAAVSALWLQWRPHFIVDVHQWVPGDSCQTPMAEASGGQLARRIAAGMCAAARHSGFGLAYRTYGTGGTLCHRYWGGVGVPAILLETIHRPRNPKMRERAITTSVVALQKTLDLLED